MIKQVYEYTSKFGLLLLCVVLFVTAQPNIIRPGKGIGPVRIGDTVVNAIRLSGWKSPAIKVVSAGAANKIYYLDYKKDQIVLAVLKKDPVDFKKCTLDTIIITNPIFVIDETGERAGGEYQPDNHPKEWRVSDGSTEKKQYFKAIGIMYSIDSTNKIIEYIAVFKPNTASQKQN